jgi:hypothetical protein
MRRCRRLAFGARQLSVRRAGRFRQYRRSKLRRSGYKHRPRYICDLYHGRLSLHVDFALSLSAAFPKEDDTYTVSLGGGIPLSDLSFDPINELEYLDGSSVDFQGPALASVTFPVASLPAAWTVKRYVQFAGVELKPPFALLDRSQSRR